LPLAYPCRQRVGEGKHQEGRLERQQGLGSITPSEQKRWKQRERKRYGPQAAGPRGVHPRPPLTPSGHGVRNDKYTGQQVHGTGGSKEERRTNHKKPHAYMDDSARRGSADAQTPQSLANADKRQQPNQRPEHPSALCQDPCH
jgi:hypothetical protein